MDQKNMNFGVLARYLADDCTEAERKYIAEWKERSAENAEKLYRYKQIWKRSRTRSLPTEEEVVEKEWARFLQRTENADAETAHLISDKKPVTSSLHSATQYLVRAAAVVLLAAILGFFSYQQLYSPEPEAPEPTLREMATSKGQRANMTMEDGSRVMLNAESSLELPTEFEEDVREVYLTGEAYFEVAEDEERPFMVHTQGSVVQVLGTAFAIRSYSKDEDVRVVVSKGSVSLASGEKENNSEAVLHANQVGRYNLQSSEISKEDVDDMQLYLSWRDGNLKFRNESMVRVARELERRYDIEVRFSDKEMEEKRLTAYLKSRSLTNVLDVIAQSIETEYELGDDTVLFTQE